VEVLGLRAPRVVGRSIALGAVVAITVLGSISASAAPTVDERELLGDSYEGRPIRVFHRGDPDETRVLVVGCIHGDECAGVRIARRLRSGRPRSSLDLWILPSLNPDGRAAHTRQNARGVDLNRNFPYRWRRGPRGRYYPGRRPASERETRIAMRLIERIEPAITIWFHQPLALVYASGDLTIERRYARLVGFPLVHVDRLHGTATSWQEHVRRGTEAFVVELPGGAVRPRRARRFANAVYRLVRA
jgi:murein peptide amidase A